MLLQTLSDLGLGSQWLHADPRDKGSAISAVLSATNKVHHHVLSYFKGKLNPPCKEAIVFLAEVEKRHAYILKLHFIQCRHLTRYIMAVALLV